MSTIVMLVDFFVPLVRRIFCDIQVWVLKEVCLISSSGLSFFWLIPF